MTHLDVDVFAADLGRSDLVVAQSEGVSSAFNRYDSTLLDLLDKHED